MWVDDEEIPAGSGPRPLADAAVSTSQSTTSPDHRRAHDVVARARLGPNFWYEAHNSPGATSTGTRWALAEGEVGGADGDETYILIANTSAFAGTARVTLLFEDGTSAQRSVSAARRQPDERRRRPRTSRAPPNRRFGAIVESLGAHAGADRRRARDVLEHGARVGGGHATRSARGSGDR